MSPQVHPLRERIFPGYETPEERGDVRNTLSNLTSTDGEAEERFKLSLHRELAQRLNLEFNDPLVVGLSSSLNPSHPQTRDEDRAWHYSNPLTERYGRGVMEAFKASMEFANKEIENPILRSIFEGPQSALGGLGMLVYRVAIGEGERGLANLGDTLQIEKGKRPTTGQGAFFDETARILGSFIPHGGPSAVAAIARAFMSPTRLGFLRLIRNDFPKAVEAMNKYLSSVPERLYRRAQVAFRNNRGSWRGGRRGGMTPQQRREAQRKAMEEATGLRVGPLSRGPGGDLVHPSQALSLTELREQGGGAFTNEGLARLLSEKASIAEARLGSNLPSSGVSVWQSDLEPFVQALITPAQDARLQGETLEGRPFEDVHLRRGLEQRDWEERRTGIVPPNLASAKLVLPGEEPVVAYYISENANAVYERGVVPMQPPDAMGERWVSRLPKHVRMVKDRVLALDERDMRRAAIQIANGQISVGDLSALIFRVFSNDLQAERFNKAAIGRAGRRVAGASVNYSQDAFDLNKEIQKRSDFMDENYPKGSPAQRQFAYMLQQDVFEKFLTIRNRHSTPTIEPGSFDYQSLIGKNADNVEIIEMKSSLWPKKVAALDEGGYIRFFGDMPIEGPSKRVVGAALRTGVGPEGQGPAGAPEAGTIEPTFDPDTGEIEQTSSPEDLRRQQEHEVMKHHKLWVSDLSLLSSQELQKLQELTPTDISKFEEMLNTMAKSPGGQRDYLKGIEDAVPNFPGLEVFPPQVSKIFYDAIKELSNIDRQLEMLKPGKAPADLKAQIEALSLGKLASIQANLEARRRKMMSGYWDDYRKIIYPGWTESGPTNLKAQIEALRGEAVKEQEEWVQKQGSAPADLKAQIKALREESERAGPRFSASEFRDLQEVMPSDISKFDEMLNTLSTDPDSLAAEIARMKGEGLFHPTDRTLSDLSPAEKDLQRMIPQYERAEDMPHVIVELWRVIESAAKEISSIDVKLRERDLQGSESRDYHQLRDKKLKEYWNAYIGILYPGKPRK